MRRASPRFNRGRVAPVAGPSGPPPEPSGALVAASQPATAAFAGSVASGLAAPQFFLNAESPASITLSTTMRATGSAPVVTLAAGTGSLTYTSNYPAIIVTIEVGAATFAISYDGGLTTDATGIVIPAGSTYTIPGGKPGAGMAIGFPVGTYTAAGTYESALSALVTNDATGYTGSQATAVNQVVFGRDATGFHLKHVSNNTLAWTHANVLALATNDPARTVMMKFRPNTADLGEDMLVWSQTGGTSGQVRYGKAVTGTGRLTAVGVTDGGATTNTNQTRGVDDLTDGGLVKFAWFGPGSAGGITCTVNDASPNPNSGTWSPSASITPTRLSVGATQDNAFRRPFAGKIYKIAVFNTQLTAPQLTAWFAAL